MKLDVICAELHELRVSALCRRAEVGFFKLLSAERKLSDLVAGR